MTRASLTPEERADVERRRAEEHQREDHAYWASVCICGQSEWERSGHYPEHEPWCEVPSPPEATS